MKKFKLEVGDIINCCCDSCSKITVTTEDSLYRIIAVEHTDLFCMSTIGFGEWIPVAVAELHASGTDVKKITPLMFKYPRLFDKITHEY